MHFMCTKYALQNVNRTKTHNIPQIGKYVIVLFIIIKFQLKKYYNKSIVKLNVSHLQARAMWRLSITVIQL